MANARIPGADGATTARRVTIARSGQRMRPVYFIGDSNVMIFSHLFADAPEYFAAPFVGRPLYCPQLAAADIAGEDGSLDPRILRALIAERLVLANEDGVLNAFHRINYAPEHALAVGELLANSSTDLDTLDSPPIVFMAGTLDLAWILAELGPNTDFLLDDPRHDPSAFPERAQVAHVPVALVRQMIRARLSRTAAALRKFVDLGFDRVFLHSVSPPTPNDARFYRWRQILTQASVRSKVTLLLNARLKAIAEESGVTFVDMWDEMAEGGVLALRYTLDGDHFTKSAAMLTLERVLGELAARAPDPVPVAQHPLLGSFVSRDSERARELGRRMRE